MTFAPEDQNGLREALARAIRAWANRFGALRPWSSLADHLIAGPLASLIAERDAANKVCDMAAMSGGFYSRTAENMERRALAAEAEITRLKEGMEALRQLSDVAAPGDWSVSGVRRRVDEASCVIIDAPSCPVLLALPTGNGVQALEALRDAKLAVAAVNFVRAALATLSPKEHPHG